MLNKIIFIASLSLSFLLFVICCITKTGAAGFFFMCIWMTLEARFALKPNKASVKNPVKVWYHSKGNPDAYRKLCIGFCVVFWVLGIFYGIINLAAGLI